jgi:hypothetical protein
MPYGRKIKMLPRDLQGNKGKENMDKYKLSLLLAAAYRICVYENGYCWTDEMFHKVSDCFTDGHNLLHAVVQNAGELPLENIATDIMDMENLLRETLDEKKSFDMLDFTKQLLGVDAC